MRKGKKLSVNRGPVRKIKSVKKVSKSRAVKKLTLKDLHREIRSIRSIVEDTNNVSYFLKGFVEGGVSRLNKLEKIILGSITEIKNKIGLDYYSQSVKQQAVIVTEADLQRAEATAAILAPEELSESDELNAAQVEPDDVGSETPY